MRISDWSSDVCSSDLLLTRYLVVSRLAAPGAQEPAEATRPLVARACSCQSWDDLLASYEEARQSVDQRWQAIVEQYGEAEDGDRKSVVEGKSVSVRVELGGRRRINKQNKRSKRN